MEVGEKLSELVKLDARVNGLKSKARELDTRINDLEKQIIGQKEVKASLAKNQEAAYDALEDASDSVAVIQGRIESLKEELKSAKAEAKANQEVVDSFTDEVMSEPDNKIVSLNQEKEKTHEERESLAKELEATRTKANNLREELKKAGYELNISGTPAPTTTHF